MSWFVIALLVAGRIVSSGWANVLQKQLVEKTRNPWGVVTASLWVVAILLLPSLVLTKWTSIPAEFWIYCALAALLDVPGNVLLVGSLGKADLSLVGPLNSLKPVVGMILGLFFLSEIPTVLGIIGVIVLAIGTWSLATTAGNAPENRGWRWLVGSAAQWRFGALALTAAASIFLKKAILLSDPWSTFAIWSWCCAAIAGVWYGWSRRRAAKPTTGEAVLEVPFSLPLIKLGVMFCALQGLSIWLFDLMPVSYALALFQLGGVVNVYLGHRIFGEQGGWRRVVISLVMVGGAVLIILG